MSYKLSNKTDLHFVFPQVILTVRNLRAAMFLYFAYGSNLLAKRIHINCPSAFRAGIGKLEGYRLDFNMYAKGWKGAVATIVPTEEKTVWGAIWKIASEEMRKLDKQEGVDRGAYVPLEVDVELPNGTKLKCRTYQQTNLPKYVKLSKLPVDRRPSPAYLNVIIDGARESELPEYYQDFLQTIPHNEYNGEVSIGLRIKECKNISYASRASFCVSLRH